MLITQAFRDDFGEIIDVGARPPSGVLIGVWTALTRLTVLTALTADLVDEIDIVDGVRFRLDFPFAAGDIVSPARQRGQLGQFCSRSTPSILSIQSTPSKPRRLQAAWRKAPPLMMITQAFRDDFGEIIDIGARPPPGGMAKSHSIDDDHSSV